MGAWSEDKGEKSRDPMDQLQDGIMSRDPMDQSQGGIMSRDIQPPCDSSMGVT